MFEFSVDSISDTSHIIGRNGNRDIPLGTTFTSLRKCRVHVADGYRTEDLGEVGRVALTLREVYCFNRSIDLVPGGYSAALVVTGDGLPLLAALLNELPPEEYLHLVGD